MPQRYAEEVMLLELMEELADQLVGHPAHPKARELVWRLARYARERQVIRQIERNGLRSPWTRRSMRELDAELSRSHRTR